MSGVIAYAGAGARVQLVTGLARLSRGGCDSAGICTLGEHGLELVRSAGHLEHLRRRINGHGVSATAGIAHAGRRRVDESAAHPLVVGDVAIAAEGETDAEAIAQLVADGYRGDLAAAVRHACTQLDGRFAFVALHRAAQGTIAGACRGRELLAGDRFLASCAAAFGSAPALRDGEVAVRYAAGLRVLG